MISDRTLSKFANAINPDNKQSDLSVILGTALVSASGDISVNIDGSDSETYIPVLSAVPFVSTGDRVIVTIRGQMAYISQNFANDLYARSLHLVGGEINLNDKFTVDGDGNLKATSGEFGTLRIGTYQPNDVDHGNIPEKPAVISRSDDGHEAIVITDGRLFIDIDGNTVLSIDGAGRIISRNGSIAVGSLSVNGYPMPHLITRKHTLVDDLTINANGYVENIYNITGQLTDLDPLGVVGYRIIDATTGGANSNQCSLSKCSLEVQAASNVDKTWFVRTNIRNHSSTAAKISIQADILWKSSSPGL